RISDRACCKPSARNRLRVCDDTAASRQAGKVPISWHPEIPDVTHERRSGTSVMRAEKGEDMFGKSNGQLLDEQLGSTPSRETKPGGTVAQPQYSAVAQPRATPQTAETSETVSTLGPGMAIVGKIDCQGTLHIFGRIEGELRATKVLIGSGAQFDGNV